MWKTKVSWLLPGVTLTHVSERADLAGRDRRRSGRASQTSSSGALTATVEDGRLTARLHQPGISLLTPVLRARLVQEDHGIVIKGEMLPTQLIALLLWLVAAIVLAGAAVQAVAAGNAWAMGLAAAMVTAFAAATPGLWRTACRHQQQSIERLEAAILARFAVDD